MSLLEVFRSCDTAKPIRLAASVRPRYAEAMAFPQEFFSRHGLVYLNRSRVADSRVKDYDWSQSPYYDLNRQEFEALTARYGADLRAGRVASVEIRDAGALGWGLFSLAPLDEGDLVGEYAGVIQENSDASPEEQIDGHYLSDYAWNYPDELPDGTEFEVNAFREGNELRFANHSSRPNMAVDHTVVDGLFVTFFRVILPVPAGGQLTVDYGREYWEGGFRTRQEL